MAELSDSGLIDIGANLTHRRFRSDLDAVLDRARAAGVRAFVATGTDVAGSEAAADLADQHADVFATAGVHPHDARHFDDGSADVLRHLASRASVVAIGECGLDYNRDYSPRPTQLECLHAQLALAAEVGLPVFLHERDAHDALMGVLREHRTSLVGAVVHCFTGTAEQAQTYLDLDLHIGVTGWICDERRGHDLRAAVEHIPLERLMVETDAPFLTPRDLKPKPKGGRNEPAFLPHVVQAVAAVLGRDAQEVADATTRTARRFFSLD